jgi:RNA polymerase sigma factor (sigma-70 family)
MASDEMMSDSKNETDRPAMPFAASAFGRYAALLHRFLVRRLKDPESANDVAQEVFSRLARIKQSEFVRKPQSYLFGIAFHVVREFRARVEQDRVTYDSEVLEQLAEHPTEVMRDELEERMNLRQQIEHALAQLPQAHRTVLLLCKRDGMTYEEAAQASGLSVHTVEKYLVQARAKMIALAWDR